MLDHCPKPDSSCARTGFRRWARRRASALCLIGVIAAVAVLAACGGGSVVVGTVEDVTPTGIDSFSSLSVRDSDGTIWVFSGGKFPAFTPSHLLEHRVTGEKVRVTFERRPDGTRSVIAIDDN